MLLLQVVGTFTSVNAEQVTQLTLGTTFKNEITTDETEDVYSFTLEKPSRIQLTFKTYVDGYVGADLLASDEVTIIGSNNLYSEPNSPELVNRFYDLEPGVYYYQIRKGSGTGNYDLTVKATEYSTNEIEWNNSAIEAQSIKNDGTKQLGVITWNDDADFYKITIDKPSRVNFTFKSYIDDYVNAEIISSDEVTKVASNGIYATNASPNQWSNYVDLEAGVYYFKVDRASDSNTGKYELSIKATPFGIDEKEPNSGIDEAAKILPNGIKHYGLISWNDNLDYYKFQVNKTSKINVAIKSYIGDSVYLAVVNKDGVNQMANTYLYANSNSPNLWHYNGVLSPGTYYVLIEKTGDNTGKYELTISTKDTTPPTAPKVTKLSSQGKLISGKAEANSTVVVYLGSKKLASTIANSKGEFKLTLKPMKKNTKLSLYAVDTSKNKSKATTIIVK